MDGSCIQLKDRCNHVHNCAHGEDEEQCAGVCEGDQWMCENTKCIDKSQVCDNVTQCQDASDEWDHCHCYIRKMGVCQDTGECLPRFRICDGTKDCKDGSDEMHCQKNWRRDNNFWYTSSSATYFETSSSSYSETGASEESSQSPTFDAQSTDPSSYYLTSAKEETSNFPPFSSEATTIDNTARVVLESTADNVEIRYASDDATNYVSKADTYSTPRYPDFPMQFLTSSRPKFGGFQPMSLKREKDEKSRFQNQTSVTSTVPDPDVRVKVYPRFQRVRSGQDAIIQCRDEGVERTSVMWKRAKNRPLPKASKEVCIISNI